MSMNSQIAHSSQTAPIKEYRVMWTQQKKQKLKKWHDGTLRFHTFNNRMLLYDEGRTLITDKYLKPGHTIDEGDEVEFEQHLATIEEFLKTVIQDLTPVFAPAIQRQQHRAATAVRNAMSPARMPAQRMNTATPASRMSAPTPRRPAPQTPMRPPQQTPRTPQTYQPVNHTASSLSAQPVQRRPIAVQTPVPAHRISAPLPPPLNPPLQQPQPSARNLLVQQPPPPPVRNAPRLPPQPVQTPVPAHRTSAPTFPNPPLQQQPLVRNAPRPPPQPVSREYLPRSGFGPISPTRHPPPPPRQKISPPCRPPPQLESRQPSPPVIQVRASPEPKSPIRPNPPRPPPRPRFSPPRPMSRPQQEPTTFPPPPVVPSPQKHPSPPSPLARPQPSRPSRSEPPLQEPPPRQPPQNQRPTPLPLKEPRAPTPPELTIIRLSDPYKKRNKLFCPPRRATTEDPPPPRKRARTTAPPPAAEVIESDSDSDPFESLPPHKPQPPPPPPTRTAAVPGLVGLPPSGARGREKWVAGTRGKEDTANKKGKEKEFPAPPQQEQNVKAAGKSLAERQAARSSYDTSGAWSIEAADLFEWKPPSMRRAAG